MDKRMNDLIGRCCLVTGGGGFIGSTIVDQLLAEGAAEVRIVDNFVRGSRNNLTSALARGAKLIEADIRDVAAVNQAMDGVDYVFHQAALRITRCAEAPREAIEVLIDGTWNVIEAAHRAGAKKVVAASSASVYGEPSYLPIDEAHPFNNRTMYGATKIANEQMLRALYETSGLEYVALRPFNVYGPRMDMFGRYTEVLIRWFEAVEAGTPPLIFGDGQQTMDFVFVEDVAHANILAAKSDVVDQVFNVGTGIQTSLLELCRLVLRLAGSPLQPEHREARSVGNVQRRCASIELAEKMLGFKAQVTLEEGLRALMHWRETTRMAAAQVVEAL
jgi:UDP-glucose 4-epimerase